MRLIRLKLNTAVATRIGFVNRELKINDLHLVEDIYSLLRLKGNGLPTQKRVQFLVSALAKQPSQTPLSASIFVRKRAQTLSELVKLPYFMSLSQLTDPVYATDKLLQNFHRLGNKVRESQCMSCTFRSKCEFGKQYGESTYDIKCVLDPDYSRTINPACPHIPEIDFANKMNEATKQLASLFDPANQEQTKALLTQLKKDAARQHSGNQVDTEAAENAEKLEEASSLNTAYSQQDDVSDEVKEKTDFVASTVSSHSRGIAYDATFSAEYYVKMQDKLIETLLTTGTEVFNIGRVLASLLSKHESKVKKDTTEQSETRRTDKMRTMGDIAKVEKLEHAMPSEIFDTKAAKKQLNVVREQKPSGKRHLLYLLIDASGSMRTQFHKNKNAIMSRASLATVLSIALMKKIGQEKGILYLRYFAGSPGPLIEVRTPEEFAGAIKRMANCNYDGGSTNIQSALQMASRDIACAVNEIHKAEVLIITDCDDSMSMTKPDLKGTKLSILDVSGTTDSPAMLGYAAHASNVLKKVADAYYKADERCLDLKSIVSLI